MTSAKTLHLPPPPPPPTSLSCILYVRSLKAVAIYRSVSSTRSNIYDGAFLQKYLATKKKEALPQMFNWVLNTHLVYFVGVVELCVSRASPDFSIPKSRFFEPSIARIILC